MKCQTKINNNSKFDEISNNSENQTKKQNEKDNRSHSYLSDDSNDYIEPKVEIISHEKLFFENEKK